MFQLKSDLHRLHRLNDEHLTKLASYDSDRRKIEVSSIAGPLLRCGDGDAYRIRLANDSADYSDASTGTRTTKS